MSDAAVLEDGSLLSRLDRGLNRLEGWLTLLAGILILAMVLISAVNIVGRGLFNRPFNAYLDLMSQSVPLIAFLGLAYCQRYGSHIRMDMVVGALRGRLLWIFELFTTSIMLFVTLALGYGAWLHTERSYRLGDSTEDINLIIWPIKAAIFIMFMMLALRLLIQLWGYGRLIITGSNQAIAVPIIEDPAAQAKREAQSVSGAEKDTNNA